MKLIYKLFAVAASILALSSCVESAIGPMTGKYEKPVVYEMNTLASQSVEKGDKYRTFTVELSGDNASMTLKMVSDKYFLADGSYTPAPADQAKKNTYIVGNGGTTFNNIPVETGSIKVAQGEGTYSFAGMLWLADESVIEIKSTVALVYEPDPEPVKLSTVLSATSNLANGVQTVTMQLAQDGIYSEMDMTTYQTIWHGEGNFLAIDLYSADGYLHEGTYSASAVGGVVGEGEFGIGYDTTVDFGWGPMEMKDWGTCWWTVADGATSAVKILDGTMTVAMEGDNVVIKLKSSIVNAKFTYPVAQFVDGTGAPIEVVNLGGGEGPEPAPDYTEFTKLLIVQPNQVYNESGQPTGEYSSFTLKVGTDGMYTEVVNNGYYDETKIKGTGQVLSIDFYTADGTVAAGTYTACEVGGTINEGEFGIGYDVEMWGQKMVWGTCVTPYESDTAGTIEKVTDGTVTVEISGDVYTITLESKNINAQYIGSLTL